MPQVPTRTQPSIQQAANPTVFQRPVSRDAFSPGPGLQQLGQSITEAADTGLDIVAREQEKQRKLDISAGRVEYTNRINSLLYGDGTPQNQGFFNLRGKAAIDATPNIVRQMETIRDDVIQQFGATDAAVGNALFNELSARESNSAGQIQQFRGRQERSYAQELSDTSKGEAAQQAAANFNNPSMIRVFMNEASALAIEDGDRNGWAPEVTNSKQQEARSLVVSQAFTSALQNGDIAAAKAILDQFGAVIDAPVKDKMVETLEDSSRLKMAFDIKDTVFGDPTLDTFEKKLKRAKELSGDDAQLRKEAEIQISVEAKRRATAQAAAVDAAFQEAGRLVDDGETLETIRQKRPDLYNTIVSDTTKFEALRRRVVSTAEGRTFAIISDGETLQKLTSGTNSQIARLNADDYKASLTESEFGRLQSAIAAAQEVLRGNNETSRIFKRAERFLADFSPEGFGLRRGDKNPKVEQIQAAKSAMLSFIQDATSQGRVLTDSDLANEARRLMLPIETTGIFGGLGRDRIVAQLQGMTAEERSGFRIDLDDIPDEAKNEVINFFEARGKPTPSDEVIEAFLGAQATGDRERQQRIFDGGPLGGRGVVDQFPGRSPKVTVPVPRKSAAALATQDSLDLEQFVSTNEGGFRAQTYLDSLGHKTVGIGFNLDRPGAKERLQSVGADFEAVRNGSVKLTQAQADQLFARDLKEAEEAVRSSVGDRFSALSGARKQALIDMAFNLGPKGFKNFAKMIRAVKNGNYNLAASEMRKSKWAKQVGTRADKVIQRMIEG